jgi:purine-binding chemotaxis protein CheW
MVLPSSGLADDILSRVELTPAAEARAPEVVQPEPRSQGLSFFSTPAREERVAAEAVEHLATFFVGGEEYGVDVRLVQEIIRITEITEVPRAPEALKGVINLRGRIIPVIDLDRKLGVGEVSLDRKARIVVVRVRERLIGLLVEGASQVLKVPVSRIEPPPEEVGAQTSVVRGVAKLDERLIMLVDLPKILADETEDLVSE